MPTTARVLQAGRSRQRPTSPADLANMLDPKFRIVPVTRLLSDIAVKAVEQPDQRDIVTMPPQSGKSRVLSIWTPVWASMHNPDMSIMVVPYSTSWPQRIAGRCGGLSTSTAITSGTRSLLTSRASAGGPWKADAEAYPPGIQSGATGFGADLLVIDEFAFEHRHKDAGFCVFDIGIGHGGLGDH